MYSLRSFWGVESATDISHWRNKDNLKGSSVKSIAMRLVMQLIILLYLFDNETSWMILLSSGVGLVIQCWKLRKCWCVGEECAAVSHVSRVSVRNNRESYTQSQTRDIDNLAFAYLSHVVR